MRCSQSVPFPAVGRCSKPWLLARQRHVLVWRRVGVTLDQAEPRLLDPRTGAVDEGQLPDVREHGSLVHELLGLVQDRLPLLGVELKETVAQFGLVLAAS